MRDDERFEIERAYDLLPHVVGASWASVWFRLQGIKKPTREEFRQKTVEFFSLLERLSNVYPDELVDIRSYMKNRYDAEIEKILSGKNVEIEKRFDRYIDYG